MRLSDEQVPTGHSGLSFQTERTGQGDSREKNRARSTDYCQLDWVIISTPVLVNKVATFCLEQCFRK